MEWYEALILGIVQGLTEFLPVSSSGHLELGNVLFRTKLEQNLTFTIVVHGATVLSTMVVFRKDIYQLLNGFFRFKWNDETKYVVYILLSMIPIGITGLLFWRKVEGLFSGNTLLVGFMLWITALLLLLSAKIRPKPGKMNTWRALLLGIAQAFAVIPGISRSGATISTGLIAGISREEVTRFSFLMVLPPVIGINVVDIITKLRGVSVQESLLVLGIGFFGAFLAGLMACAWMIRLVKKGRLIYFSVYCFAMGALVVILSLL
ncbi:MAG TPA: undecaprenyl-diphosphate phosphatase [Bacteroidetes bacterium]|nr:undecaprenyl-diphosphate phosphatase [Bacteroidota bacterium]